MKTIKQIADELGVDKQKIYRYIRKNHINEVHHEAHQNNKVKYYDEVAEKLIKQAFQAETTSSEVHHEAHHEVLQTTSNDAVDVVIEMLRKELEIKNQQIKELNERLAESQRLLNQQQQLNAVSEQKLLQSEDKKESSSFWTKLFGN